jgi:hypothetical protein
MRFPVAAAALAATLCLPAWGASESDDGQRAEVRTATDALADRFLALRPRLRPELKAAPGYAIFTTTAGNIFGTATGGGKGVGIARRAREDHEIFMLMQQSGDPQTTLDREILIVFTTVAAVDKFIKEGLKAPGKEPLPDARVYWMKGGGVETSGSLEGGRFWVDPVLN